MDKNFVFFPFFNYGVYFAFKLAEMLNISKRKIVEFSLFQTVAPPKKKALDILFEKEQDELFHIMDAREIGDLFVDLSKSIEVGSDESSSWTSRVFDPQIADLTVCRPPFTHSSSVNVNNWRNESRVQFSNQPRSNHHLKYSKRTIRGPRRITSIFEALRTVISK